MIEDRVFSVYIHKFPNGKQYVGITRKLPKYRWNSGNGYKDNKVMYRDIKKYGWDNIEHILFNDEDIFYNEEEACYIEKCLIDSWELLNPEKGYNLLSGGTASYTHHKDTIIKLRKHFNKPVVQYDMNGRKIREFYSLAEVERELKFNPTGISQCCNRNKRYSYVKGYIWRWKEDNLESVEPQQPKEKEVVQYSLDGSKIREFSSIKEASLITGSNSSGISACCLGKYKQLNNYIWRYKIDNLKSVKPIQPRIRPVIQYSLDGSKIREFSSTKEAEEFINTKQKISRCCSGKQKTIGGYIWKYKE